MDKLSLALEEYKLTVSICEKFYDRMYNILYFTIVYYGAIAALAFTQSPEGSYIQSAFYSLLPAVTYVLGLFYAYNAYSIAKAGLDMLHIETDIQKLAAEIPSEKKKASPKAFQGWILRTRPKRGHDLAYGTALAFFLLAPLLYYLAVFGQYGIPQNFFAVLSGLCYLIYLLFSAVIIKQLLEVQKEKKRLRQKK